MPVLPSPDAMPSRMIAGGETLRDIQYVELHKDWAEGVKRLLDVVAPDDARQRDARLSYVSESPALAHLE